MTLITTKRKQAPLTTITSPAPLQKLLLKETQMAKPLVPICTLGSILGIASTWLCGEALYPDSAKPELLRFVSRCLWSHPDRSSNHPGTPGEGQSAISRVQGVQQTGTLAEARWLYRQLFLRAGVHLSNLILLVLLRRVVLRCVKTRKKKEEKKDLLSQSIS